MKRLLVLATVGLFVLCLGSAYGYDLEETLAYDYGEGWTIWDKGMLGWGIAATGIGVILLISALGELNLKVEAQKEIDDGELRRLRMEEKNAGGERKVEEALAQRRRVERDYATLKRQHASQIATSRKLAEKLLESLEGTVASMTKKGEEYPSITKKEVEAIIAKRNSKKEKWASTSLYG